MAGPVCSSFSAEACTILQALCWSRQDQQVCHFSSLLFLFFDSCSVLKTLSSPYFLLPQSLSQEQPSLFSCSIRLVDPPPTRRTPIGGYPRVASYDMLGEQLHYSNLVKHGCPLISRIHSCLFSVGRRTVSSKFFDTQAPPISTEELVLTRHFRCVLSRLRCNGRSLLSSCYFSRIGRIENPCSACRHSSQDTSHLILHYPATDSAPLALR